MVKPMTPEKCDCMVYLAGIDYEGYQPVYLTDRADLLSFWKVGDDQIYFKFCPLCGKKIDRPQ